MTKHDKVIYSLIAVMGIVILSLSAWIVLMKVDFDKKAQGGTNVINIQSNTNLEVGNTNSSNLSNLNTNGNIATTDKGVTYITPEKLGDLSLFKSGYFVGDAPVAYYLIARLDSGSQIILVVAPPEDPSGDIYLRFLKTNGKYYFLPKYSPGISADTEPADFLANYNVSTFVDEQSVFTQLDSPDSITLDGGAVLRKSWQQTTLDQLGDYKEVANSPYGSILEEKTNADANSEIGVRVLYLKHADNLVTQYRLKFPFVNDDKGLQFALQNNEAVTSYIAQLSASCGNRDGLSYALKSDIASRIVKSEKTTTNEDLYKIKSSDDPLLKEIYNFYKIGREQASVSYDDFAKLNPVFIYRDFFNDYQIFLSADYGALAECGKPVVYLYPEKDMNVSVKVAADITKSEPIYGNGWSVFAKPNGQIISDGKAYPYLFWEGQGQKYPEINSGFIVKKENLSNTI
ncbi:MAG: hypothetical protein WCO23_03640, partial [bacterium]